MNLLIKSSTGKDVVSRRVQMIVAAASLAACSSIVDAALPIFAGPGTSPIISNAVQAPEQETTSTQVNNAGIAIASAVVYNGSNEGPRVGFRWQAGTGLAAVMLNTADTTAGVDFTSRPVAITASGMVLTNEQAVTEFLTHAVKYAPASTTPVRLLGRNAETYAQVYSANAKGTIVGKSDNQPAIWGASASNATLLEVPSTGEAWASNITDAGVIAGEQRTSGYDRMALRWSNMNAPPAKLAPISTDQDRRVSAMNAFGTVVGRAAKVEGTNYLGPRAVRWDSGTTLVTELGTLGIGVNGQTSAWSTAINDRGEVVGVSTRISAFGENLGVRATRWAPNTTTAIELTGLGVNAQNVTYSEAIAINNLGASVGRALVNGDGGNYHATLWLPGSTAATDLNDLDAANSGWTFRSINGISDTGFVTGIADYKPSGGAFQISYERAFTMLVPQAGTYGRGDANLDTIVNFDDLVILAQHYNAPNAAQKLDVGDLNLDGVVNFDDLVPLAQNYNKNFGVTSQGTLNAPAGSFEAGFAADWALAQSLVPEPAAISLIVLPVAAAGRQRRRLGR